MKIVAIIQILKIIEMKIRGKRIVLKKRICIDIELTI